MKNIKKILVLLILVISLVSCDEEDNFVKSEIELVPVFAITDISGSNAPFAINIYQQKSLIVEYSSSINAKNYVSSGYSDTSTDSTYEISVTKLMDNISVNYDISADKLTGDGTLTVDAATVYNIMVSEEEVYN